MRRPHVAVGVLSLLSLLSLPALAPGQQVQGRVIDDAEETPVAGATVALEDSTGRVIRRVVVDAQGIFWIWHTEAGAFRLSAKRIGYATVAGQPFRLDSAHVVEVEIRMRPRAVPVEPLRVVARREIERFTPDEFYDRMSRLEDRGSFLTRQDIEDSRARLPSLAVAWVPGTWVEPSGRSAFTNTVNLASYGKLCSPAVYLNGRELPDWAALDDFVMVDRIEGIEIYRGNSVPDTYARDPDSWGCGMILVWTKTEHDPRFAFNWERTIMFGVLGGLLFGLTSLF
ncbi:MAG: carboxypeptidase-like regulatory domain-containing protein [Longimicrobiales bacterium]